MEGATAQTMPAYPTRPRSVTITAAEGGYIIRGEWSKGGGWHERLRVALDEDKAVHTALAMLKENQ